jgi:hypothetical protein
MFSPSLRLCFRVLLILLPVLVFGVYIFENAVNVPYDDDEALIFSINMVHEKGADFFHALIIQHNDHRIFFSRLAAVLIDFFTGEINFRTMIILGYLNLILLGHGLYLVFRSVHKNLIFFLPVSILLFSPLVYVVHLWSITAFEQTLAITFSIYCLYFLQPSRQKTWYFSIPLVIAATMANLDGLSIIPVGLVWLLLQKRNREALIFGVFSVFYLFVFFKEFRFSFSSEAYTLTQTIWLVFRGFVSFTGSIVKVFSDSHVYLLSLSAGGFILVVYLIFFAGKFFRKEGWSGVLLPVSFVEICFLKLLACGFMIAMGRGIGDIDSMAAMRFQVYSVSILALFYLFVLSNLSHEHYKKALFSVFLICTLTLHLWAYAKYDSEIATHNNELKADAYNFPNHSFFIHQHAKTEDHDKRFFRYYSFPNYFKENQIQRWTGQLKNQEPDGQAEFKTNIVEDKSHYGAYKYPVLGIEVDHLPADVPRKEVYLLLEDTLKNTKPYLVALKFNNSEWLGNLVKKNLPPPSFSAIIPQKMEEGVYHAVLCWTEKGSPKSILLPRNFRVGKD